jgi:hypothetical protein
MLHCAVGHWGALHSENLVSSMGWVKHWQELGPDKFRRALTEMMIGSRPMERAAFVVAGAAFPRDLDIRNSLLLKIHRSDRRMAIAALYGLAAHLDVDEDIADRLLIYSMKLPKDLTWQERRDAVKEVLFLWVDSAGSGRCKACGKAPGSL